MIRRNLLAVLVLTPLTVFCSNPRPAEAGPDTVQTVRTLPAGLPPGAVLQQVVLPPVPAEASFAGEAAPLHYFDVYEALQRELTVLTYWHGSMSYILQLSGRYRALVESILKEEGVPADFFYLCVAESSLQPAVSPANAKGYWQFLAATAKEYGLEVSSEVDERFHWEKSTRAACRYLKKAYEKFGTWTLAAASYNTGLSNVESRIKYQSLTDYYDMQWPAETGRYLFRILALKTVMNNPALYGFRIPETEYYRPLEFERVEVKGRIENWSDFAREHHTNFRMLKMYNEWIRSNKLENKANKTYTVWVPAEGSRERK